MAQSGIDNSVFTGVAFFATLALGALLAFGACGANIALIAFRTIKFTCISVITDALGKLLGGVCGELKSASTKGEFTVIIAPRGFEL